MKHESPCTAVSINDVTLKGYCSCKEQSLEERGVKSEIKDGVLYLYPNKKLYK